MSEPAGTLRVRVEPDLTGFKDEAAKQAQAQNLDEAFQVSQKAFQESQLRLTALKNELKEIAGLQKTLADARALTQDKAVLQRFLDVRPELSGLDERAKKVTENIILEQRLAQATRKRADAAADAKLGLTTPVTAGPAAPGGGGFFGPGGTLRDISAGRTAGIGGLIAAGSRLGLVGLAATTAFQAVGELQNALRATGDEAFTTEGKLRNLGAELLGGNLIGGVKALLARKPAEFDKPLQTALATLKEFQRLQGDTAITAEELVRLQQTPDPSRDERRNTGFERYKQEVTGASDALEQFLAIQVASGALSKSQAKDLAAVTLELTKQNAAIVAAGDSILQSTRRMEQRGGDRLRGVGQGAAFQQTGIPAGQSFTDPQQARAVGQANLQVMNAIRASITARIENDKERAAQELEDAKIIEAQATAAARQAHGTAEWGVAKAAQVQAETVVLEKQRALAKLAEDQLKASQARGNSIRAAEAGLIKNGVERAAAEEKNARIVASQAKAVFESKRHAEGVGEAWTAYRLAVIGVQEATAASKQAVEDAAAEAVALGNSVRESIASRIPDEEAQQQALLRAARLEQKNARAAFEAKRGTDEANNLWDAYVAAKTKTILIEQGIKEAAKAAAEAAAQSAANAQQQALQNAITIAEQSGNIPAIKAAYSKAIAYWQAIADGSKATSEAHQGAVAQVLSLTAAMEAATSSATTGIAQARIQNDMALAALKGLDTKPFLVALVRFAFEAMKNAKAGTLAFEQARGAWIAARQNLASMNDTLNDLKRANARARAALTEGEEDDERLLRAEIRRLDKKVKATKGMGVVHQQAIAQMLAAERELQGMVDEIKPTTTVFDLLTESTAAFVEHAGNVINAGNKFTADSFTSGLRGQIGTQPNAAGRARLGLDDDRIVSATDRNTTALDRLTAQIGARSGAGGSAVTAGANMATPSRGDVVGLRYKAMAERYAEVARAARGGIN